MMSNVGELKLKNDQPYQMPLRVKVIAVGAKKSYMANEVKKEFLPVVFADGSGAIRANVYDLEREDLLKEGNCVYLKGYILRSEQRSSKKYLVITTVTKIFKGPTVVVGEDVLKEGREIINPPPAPEKNLQTAKSSPIKTMLSVKGQIVSEDLPVVRQIGGNAVKVKTVTLKDDTATCKVALWRELSDAPVQTGDFVSLQNVVVATYRNEVSLSSTSLSTIMKTEQPEEKRNLTVQGFEIVKDEFHFLMACGDEFIDELFICKSTIVKQRYGEEDLNVLLPFEVTVNVQGQEITEFCD